MPLCTIAAMQGETGHAGSLPFTTSQPQQCSTHGCASRPNTPSSKPPTPRLLLLTCCATGLHRLCAQPVIAAILRIVRTALLLRLAASATKPYPPHCRVALALQQNVTHSASGACLQLHRLCPQPVLLCKKRSSCQANSATAASSAARSCCCSYCRCIKTSLTARQRGAEERLPGAGERAAAQRRGAE